MNRYFKYILLAIFLAAVLLIVFLQFNSNRSINKLIYSNENLLSDLSIKTGLQRIQAEILSLESKVRGTVIRGALPDSDHLQEEVRAVRRSLQAIAPIRSDRDIQPLLQSLNSLVNAKINLNTAVIDTFRLRGKIAAENLINADHNKKLLDSVRLVLRQIDDLHERTVTSLIREADSNGRKARAMGTILAIIAALASLFTFGYISYKIRQQQILISQLNQSEKKARDAALIKEKFLANMSHEIRTPLNAILGFTNLLQKKELDEESKSYVQTLQQSGENLLTIVNDVLDLSKIEAGMLRIEQAPFSIRGLVHTVEAMFLARATEKKLQLRSLISEEMPDTLEGDATRLTQILVNLTGNAIKFTEKGTITIRVSPAGKSGDTVKAKIEVMDTGIGILPENLEKIFDRFQQEEDSSTRKYGGTGLGLAIVQELVQLQQGTVSAASTPGAGTTFTVVIPYNIAAVKETNSPGDIPVPVTPASAMNSKVLVVEDNVINQTLIRQLFRNIQIPFDMVNNGREAVALLKEKNYGVILMDIQMPEMDGYMAAKEIRHTLRLSTPIIAMTAHAMTGEREKCIGQGMNEYIAKPFREAELHQLILKFTTGKANGILSSADTNNGIGNPYSCINTDYMQEVSGGDPAYEKEVTSLFIETVPANLASLQKAWQEQDLTTIRHLAHDLKTTVAIMGLDEKLTPCLQLLENEPLTESLFEEQYRFLADTCTRALAEARDYLGRLTA